MAASPRCGPINCTPAGKPSVAPSQLRPSIGNGRVQAGIYSTHLDTNASIFLSSTACPWEHSTGNHHLNQHWRSPVPPKKSNTASASGWHGHPWPVLFRQYSASQNPCSHYFDFSFQPLTLWGATSQEEPAVAPKKVGFEPRHVRKVIVKHCRQIIIAVKNYSDQPGSEIVA